MEEKFAYNPEIDGLEVDKAGVNESMAKVLSVPNDPQHFLSKIQKYFSVESIRKSLIRVGGRHELETMLFDPHITAAMSKRKAGIRGARISFESDSEDEVSFVEDNIKPEVINHILKNMWETWFYGYSVDELIWENDGGNIKIKDIRKVPFYWFNPANDLKSVFYKTTLSAEQTLHYDEPATYGKYLLTTKDATYVRPHGMGIAFSIYFVSKFKEMGWDFWGQWLQKYASGFITAQIPQEQSDEASEIKKQLKDAIRGAAIVYTEGSEVKIEWPSSSGDQFKVFRDSAIEDINLAILGETLTSKVDGGSRAAATVHDSIQKEIIQLDMEIVEEAVSRLIEYTYTLNFRDKKNMPKVKVFFERSLQKERAERDLIVSQASPEIKFTKKYLIDSYDYKEEDLEEVVAPAEVGAGEFHDHSHHEFAGLTSKDNDLLEYLEKNAYFGVDELDVLAIVESSETAGEFARKLEGLMDIDTTNFEEELTKATFYQFGKGMKLASK